MQAKPCSTTGCKKATQKSEFFSIWGSFWMALGGVIFKMIPLGPPKNLPKSVQGDPKVDFGVCLGRIFFWRWVWGGFWKGLERISDGFLGLQITCWLLFCLASKNDSPNNTMYVHVLNGLWMERCGELRVRGGVGVSIADRHVGSYFSFQMQFLKK